MILENLKEKARKGVRETIKALKIYKVGEDVDRIRKAIVPLEEVVTLLDYMKYDCPQGALIASVLINSAMCKVGGILNGLEELYPLSEFIEDRCIEQIYTQGIEFDREFLIPILESILLMIEEITTPPTAAKTTH